MALTIGNSYDQGVMGGVNNAKGEEGFSILCTEAKFLTGNLLDYIYLMGFGYVDENDNPVITNTLLQGGIVRSLPRPLRRIWRLS